MLEKFWEIVIDGALTILGIAYDPGGPDVAGHRNPSEQVT